MAPETASVSVLVDRVAERLDSVEEARDLIAAYLDVPRHWPLLNGNAGISRTDWEAVIAASAKRAGGAPMQYAVGKANFRRLTLAVDERVLIPRPETELLVDLVLQRAPRGGVAVDVGTGSGAIAIALATEGRFERVIGTDISLDAIQLATNNARRIGAHVEFMTGDLLSHVAPFTSDVQAIVSNPPYIAFDEARQLPVSVRDWEPAVALFSPGDGLSVTERLVAEAGMVLQEGGVLALEVDARRASLVAELLARDPRFVDVSVELDLTGRERFVLGIRRRRDDA